MQLTRFDRWLREKFVYEYHVQTMRPPEPLPKGFRTIAMPGNVQRNFKHHYVTRKSECFDRLVQTLKQSGQMYHTQVVERRSWTTPFLAPKNKSVTWGLFSMTIIISGLLSAAYGIRILLQDPEIRQNLIEAFDILRS